jgi:membrane protease YdiL (CAAX protease family)
LAAAGASPMLADLKVDRPWLRFGSFLALASIFSVLVIPLALLALASSPDMADVLREPGVLSDTVDRLIKEGYMAVGLGMILGAVALAILFAAAITYRRWPGEFLWPDRTASLRHFGLGFAGIGATYVAIIPYYLLTGSTWDPPILNPDYLPSTRAPYVVMTLVGLFIAAAAEEVVCRGVLLRLTTQISKHALILCAINGVLFSALHLDPDPVAFVARTISGMIWTWAAIRLGGLEFAVGAHLASNFVLSMLVSPLSESSLPSQADWIDLAPEVLVGVITIALVERLARSRPEPAREVLASR